MNDESLRQRFARIDPHWNKRPEHLESKEDARRRIAEPSLINVHPSESAELWDPASPIGLRQPWKWEEPVTTTSLMLRLQEAADYDVPELEHKHLELCAIAALRRLVKLVADLSDVEQTDVRTTAKLIASLEEHRKYIMEAQRIVREHYDGASSHDTMAELRALLLSPEWREVSRRAATALVESDGSPTDRRKK